MGRVVLDLSSLDSSEVLPELGVAFATAVDVDGRPIVTRSLSGTVTIADLVTGSAWGGATIARRALQTGGASTLEPALGTIIDGVGIFLEQLQPEALELPAYYALDGTGGHAPAALVFVSFADTPGDVPLAAPSRTEWIVEAHGGDGTTIDVPRTTVQGLQVLALDTLAGAAARTAGGSLSFEVGDAQAQNRLIFFHQSLDGFGVGFVLPPTTPSQP